MQRVIYLRQLRARRDEHGLQQQLERVFQRQWGHPASIAVIAKSREPWRPPADVYETAAALVVKIELPGMRDAEIAVTLDERSLYISGQRAEQPGSQPQYYHQMGITYGAFELEVFLARPVDYDRVTAEYDDGFLIVELPKPEERPQGERIQVKVTGGEA